MKAGQTMTTKGRIRLAPNAGPWVRVLRTGIETTSLATGAIEVEDNDKDESIQERETTNGTEVVIRNANAIREVSR